MKKVTLKSLTLINFKGEKERTTNFNQSVTTIAGDNGLGKTRHFDAFLWLLFGKDTLGRENYEIKTRINGKQLQKVECGVEGVLDIDGVTVKIKRMWVEDWVKSKGETEPKLKGNHTDCYWNEVPINVTEYKKRVNEIIDETLFKMITNPVFFVNMEWKNQREQLFQLAGSSLSDKEIATGNADFEKLLDTISGKSLADYKKEIGNKKKLLKSSLDEIQPRIDQTYKMMPQSLDWENLKSQKADIDKEIIAIDEQIADHAKAMRANYESEQQKNAQINDLKKQQQNIIHDAEMQAIQETNNANDDRRILINTINNNKNQLNHLNAMIERDKVDITRINSNMTIAVKKQEELRQRWFAESSKQYEGNTKCPHCGQELPEAMKKDALRIFNERKKEILDEITVNGKQIGVTIESYKKEINDLEARIGTNTKEVENLNILITADTNKLNTMPLVPTKTIVASDIQEWVSLESQIQAITAALSSDNTNIDNSELTSKKVDLMAKRDAIIKDLHKQDDIARMTKEIEHLNLQSKNLVQQIADIEHDECTMAAFSKKKIEDCETRINGMFKFVKFKLFDYTIEGNEYETCVPLVNGVPWNTANDAGKINAGLDIINTLIHFYNVCAPIFIDRKESINKPVDMDTQVIYLKVTDDKELKIY